MRRLTALLALALALPACRPAKAAPAVPGVRVTLQAATDSTVRATVTIAPPSTGTPPFSYVVTVGSNDAGVVYEDSAAGDSLTYGFDVPRADARYSAFICARAENAAGAGPNACTSFDIPPRIVLPGAPGVDVQVDTLVASLDSVTLDADSVAFRRVVSTFSSDTTWDVRAYKDGRRIDSAGFPVGVAPTYQLTALGWLGDSIVVCSGACNLALASRPPTGRVIRLAWAWLDARTE